MALYVAGDFSGYSATYAVPSDYDGDPLYTGATTLILSTGVTQTVHDALSTALKQIHYMDSNNLYSMMPNEDITIINLRSKLMILENTYINQKLMNNFVFKYDTSGKVQAVSRNSSIVFNLEDALTSMGFRCFLTPWSTDCNPKLETNQDDDNRPRIQIIDLYYKHPSDPNTNLEDSTLIIPGEV
jgi:hypothetical protein